MNFFPMSQANFLIINVENFLNFLLININNVPIINLSLFFHNYFHLLFTLNYYHQPSQLNFFEFIINRFSQLLELTYFILISNDYLIYFHRHHHYNFKLCQTIKFNFMRFRLNTILLIDQINFDYNYRL
jgi:hypothetical protein